MTAALTFVLLAAPPGALSATSSVTAAFPAGASLAFHTPLLIVVPVRSRDKIRADYKQLARRTNPTAHPDPLELTPELLLLYWELEHPRSMPGGERLRMRRALRAKLERMRDRLVRLHNRVQKKQRPQRRSASGRLSRASKPPVPSSAVNQVSASGGAAAVAARANQLIDLIQQTIAPETWAVNGGRGTISFLGSPFYVLVVRNTGEVHHQLGGFLPVLPGGR